MSDENIKDQYRLEKRDTSHTIYLNVATRTKGTNMPDFHYHTSYELFYIKSGRADFIIGRSTYTVFDGNLLVIPPYVPHRSMYLRSKTDRIEVCIEETQIDDKMVGLLKKMSQNICYTISLKHQEFIMQLFSRIGDELRCGGVYSQELCRAYTYELLIMLYRHAVSTGMPGCIETAIPERIMEYISENYGQKIIISELAEKFHVCESTIYKSFKKYTGLKITDYINFTRVMNAERLMRETKLPLAEIAYQCGFNDCNYFSTVFGKYKSISPGKFMKSCRGTSEQ